MRVYAIPASHPVVLLVPDVAQSNVTLCIYIYIYYLYLSIHLLHICQQISVYVEGDLCFEMRANTKPITSNLASPLRNLKNAVVLRILYFTKFAFFAPNINQIKRNALCTSCFANTIVQTTQSSILTISNCPKYGFGIRKTPAYRWKYPWQETVVIWKTIIHYLNPLWKLRDKLQYNLVTIQERFQSSHLSSLCDFSSFLKRTKNPITTQHHTPLVATVQPSLWQHLGQTLKARSTQLKTSLTPHWSPDPWWWVGGWWERHGLVGKNIRKSCISLYIPVR